jgi:lipopolysaccharide export system protein LptA
MMPRLLLLLLILSASALQSRAQETTVPFGSEGHDITQRIEVTADHLELDQAEGTAHFTGAVRAAQGALRIAADSIVVHYAETEAASSQGQITRLEAEGNVTLTNGEEAAEAQEATYDVSSGIIVMERDVLITQGSNALASQTLRIDLTTGQGAFGGRVRTVFDPGSTQ